MRTGIRCLFLLGSTFLAGKLLAQTQETPPGLQTPSAAGVKTQPKTGSIHGRVVAADTEAALGKATLRLSSSEPQGRERPAATRTNAQGEYEFKNVKPGRYNLWADRNGYVSHAYGQKSSDPQRSQGTVLMVRAGETLSEIDLKLIRGGVIEGRVVDPDGEPVANVEVSVERYVTREGKRSLRSAEEASTDDRGQFRIFGISPGKYYVRAQYQIWARDDEGDSTYPPVYYPGTLSAQEASRIEVVPGSEVHGIDIALTESKAFSISGKVFRADGKPAVEAMVTSTRIEEAGWGGWTSRGGPVDAEGNFKLRGLLPGRYRIAAESRRSERRQLAGITLDVGSEDVRGVSLALGDGGEISGRVIIEGGDPKFLPATLRVMLESEVGRMMDFRMEGGEVLEDRTFSIRNLTEGAYRLRMFFQFGNLYLKSARVQGEDALDQAFEIRNGEKVTGAEIVLSANGGELAGAVKQEENGEAVKGATIVLFSADPRRQAPRSRWTRTTQSDQQGNFQLRGLAPGEYLVCAVLNHEAGAESAPDYIQELAKNAKEVSIRPGTELSESLLIQPTPIVE